MLKLFRGWTLKKKEKKKDMSCQLNKLAVAVALKVLLSDFFCCYTCTTVPTIKKVMFF